MNSGQVHIKAGALYIEAAVRQIVKGGCRNVHIILRIKHGGKVWVYHKDLFILSPLGEGKRQSGLRDVDICTFFPGGAFLAENACRCGCLDGGEASVWAP